MVLETHTRGKGVPAGRTPPGSPAPSEISSSNGGHENVGEEKAMRATRNGTLDKWRVPATFSVDESTGAGGRARKKGMAGDLSTVLNLACASTHYAGIDRVIARHSHRNVFEAQDVGSPGGLGMAWKRGSGSHGRSYMDLLVGNMLQLTQLPSLALDDTRRSLPAKGSIAKSLYKKSPFGVALQIWWVKLSLFLIGAVALGIKSAQEEYLMHLGVPSMPYYRFTALETRDGSTTPTGPAISGVGFLIKSGAGDCVSTRTAGFWTEGASAILDIPPRNETGWRFRGWYFITSEGGDPSQDPVRFVLEASRNKRDWHPVGGSGYRWVSGHHYDILPDQLFDTPVQRSSPVFFDMRVRWTILGYSVVGILWGITLVGTSIVSTFSDPRHGTIVFIAGNAITGALCAAYGIGFALEGDQSGTEVRSGYFFATAVIMGGVALALIVTEAWYPAILSVSGLLFFTTLGVHHALLSPAEPLNGRGEEGGASVISIAALAMYCALSLTMLCVSLLTIYRAVMLVKKDKAVYDEEWERVSEVPGEASALKQLALVVDEAATAVLEMQREDAEEEGRDLGTLLRQYNRIPTSILGDKGQQRGSTKAWRRISSAVSTVAEAFGGSVSSVSMVVDREPDDQRRLSSTSRSLQRHSHNTVGMDSDFEGTSDQDWTRKKMSQDGRARSKSPMRPSSPKLSALAGVTTSSPAARRRPENPFVPGTIAMSSRKGSFKTTKSVPDMARGPGEWKSEGVNEGVSEGGAVVHKSDGKSPKSPVSPLGGGASPSKFGDLQWGEMLPSPQTARQRKVSSEFVLAGAASLEGGGGQAGRPTRTSVSMQGDANMWSEELAELTGAPSGSSVGGPSTRTDSPAEEDSSRRIISRLVKSTSLGGGDAPAPVRRKSNVSHVSDDGLYEQQHTPAKSPRKQSFRSLFNSNAEGNQGLGLPAKRDEVDLAMVVSVVGQLSPRRSPRRSSVSQGASPGSPGRCSPLGGSRHILTWSQDGPEDPTGIERKPSVERKKSAFDTPAGKPSSPLRPKKFAEAAPGEYHFSFGGSFKKKNRGLSPEKVVKLPSPERADRTVQRDSIVLKRMFSASDEEIDDSCLADISGKSQFSSRNCGEPDRRKWLKNTVFASSFNPNFNKLEDAQRFTVDPSSPVMVLDQLLAQAKLLDNILLSKAITWASMSKGKFPSKTGEGFISFQDAMSAEGLKFGEVKHPARCVDKARLAYDGDVSRVVDYCRQRIVFDSVKDLLDCIRLLDDDDSVRIHRIKSTMDSRADNNPYFTGYRFVSINMVICDEDTADLCVENHVCELLLELNCFAKLLVFDLHKHKRYTRYQFYRRYQPYVMTVGAMLNAVSKMPKKLYQMCSDAYCKLAFSTDPRIPSQEIVNLENVTVQPPLEPRAGGLVSPFISATERGTTQRQAPHRNRGLEIQISEVNAAENLEPKSSADTGNTTGETNGGTGERKGSKGEMNGGTGESNVSKGEMNGGTGRSQDSKGEMNGGKEEMNCSTGDSKDSTGEMKVGTGDSKESKGEMKGWTGDSKQSKGEMKGGTDSEDAPTEGRTQKFFATTSFRGTLSPPPSNTDIQETSSVPVQSPNASDFSELGLTEIKISPAPPELQKSPGQTFDFKTSNGVEISSEMVEVLETYCRVAALGLSNLMDRNWKQRFRMGFEDADSKSVIFTSSPISAISAKGVYQGFFLCMALAFLLAAILHISVYEGHDWTRGIQSALCPRSPPKAAFKHFRFVNLETRDRRENITSPGIQYFGVQDNSLQCKPEQMHTGEMRRLDDHRETDIIAEGIQEYVFGNSYYLSFQAPVPVVRWFLVTADGPADSRGADPAYFEVHGTADDLAEGSVLGAGDSTFDPGANRTWHVLHTPVVLPGWGPCSSELTSQRFDLATEGGHIHEFSVEGNWPFVVNRIMEMMAMCVTLVTYVALGRFNGALGARNALALGLVAVIVMSLVSSFGYLVLEQPVHAWCVLAEVPVKVVCLVGIVLEPRIMSAVLTAGLVDTLRMVLVNEVLFGGDTHRRWMNAVASGPFMILVWLVVQYRRWHSLRESQALVREDRDRYDALWLKELQAEREAGKVEMLEKAVQQIEMEARPCRQLNRPQADKTLFRLFTSQSITNTQSWAGSLGLPKTKSDPWTQSTVSRPTVSPFLFFGRRKSSRMASIDVWNEYPDTPARNRYKGWWQKRSKKIGRPIKSIDQLYAQAVVLNVVLGSKVRLWAEASRGMFPVKSKIEGHRTRVSYLLVGESLEGDQCEVVQGTNQRQPLKKHRRGIEKMMRSYGNDPSRLVDIARHAIVFETLADISLCLNIIRLDHEVDVLRVKNRLSESYDVNESAGYRDVCLNICVVNPVTTALGAETHVCEVQLILRKFAELKTKNGHSRYVRFRNARGC